LAWQPRAAKTIPSVENEKSGWGKRRETLVRFPMASFEDKDTPPADDDSVLVGIKSDPTTIVITDLDSRRLRWLARQTLTTKTNEILVALVTYVATNAAVIATAFSILISDVELDHHAYVDLDTSPDTALTFKHFTHYDPSFPSLNDEGLVD
jgi:hypothetical protein